LKQGYLLQYLYRVLFYLVLPFLFLRLLWRSVKRSADYRKRWGERLGFFPQSVGETIAAVPLIKALKTQYPEIPLVITNMTITGSARTRAIFGETVLHSYIPYDVPGAVNRFLNRINPVVAIILETELWPTLFASCEKRKIPLLLANARLSEKSAKGYQRIASITKQMLSAITLLAVQTQVEAERFIKLGLPANRVRITGNIKFDLEIPQDLIAKGAVLREQLGQARFIWVAASTHATEEEIILRAHKQILAKHPGALLILVPRHPDRFETIFDLVQEQGFAVARRSQGSVAPGMQVYLGDTMGELLLMYSTCDVAFVGGSFVEVGGHNMLEAAVLGKPAVTGPILFNFAEISRSLIAAGGMTKVADGDELVREILRCIEDPTHRQTSGENARQFVAANRGALAKQLEYSKELIGQVV
jgi:3-deoxy-D-manno-octulosonic-acid transferase